MSRASIIPLLLASVLPLAGCHRAQPDAGKAAAKAELPTIQADVMAVQPQVWPTMVLTQGTLAADEVAVVGAKVSGRVEEVNVDLGDQVAAKAPLAALDKTQFELEVAAAEAALTQARAAVGLPPGAPVESLVAENAPPVKEQKAVWDDAKAKSDRYQQLLAQKAVTQIEAAQYLAAEQVAAARYASAVNAVNEKIALIYVQQSALALARERLQESTIVAPFDAMVRERHVAPGSFVQAGQAVATVVRTSALRFRGMLPEIYVRELAVGKEVRLSIEGTSAERVVKITRISPSLDELSRSLLFEAEIDNSDGLLRSGLFAQASVVLNPDSRAIAVPPAAIVEFAGIEKVWKLVNGVAQEQVVQTGQRRKEGVEITQGLEQGDVILKDGLKGKIARVTPNNPVAAPKESAVAETAPPPVKKVQTVEEPESD